MTPQRDDLLARVTVSRDGTGSQIRVLACGDRAVLVETPAPLELFAALRRAKPRGLRDAVPAEASVLLRFDRPIDVPTAGALLSGIDIRPLDESSAAEVRIPVRYDGADLHDVAATCGLSPEAVVALHAGGDYVAAFCGFSPGFAYLTGLSPQLHLPRRPTPRTSVPAGSVAIAGHYTAVYPTASPGGWALIGHTDLRLWDVAADPPAAIRPGTRVRFLNTSGRSA